MEGKALSNKAFSSLRSDSCSSLRERVSESWERPFQDCGEKKPHSQGVQDAEFAVVGIGIALLRSHAQKAAFVLNRSGDYAFAGREIAFISERAEYTTSTSEYYVSAFPPTSDRSPVRPSERSGLHFALATCRMHYAYL